MTATDSTTSPAVPPAPPPAPPPRIYCSTSDIPSSQPIKPPRKNKTKPSVTISDEIAEAIYEDPDALLNSIPDVSQSEAKPKPIPRPRSKAKLNPQLYDTKSTTKPDYVSMTNSGHNNKTNNSTYNENMSNTTDNANTTRTTNKANTIHTSSATYRTPSSVNDSTVDSTYNTNRTYKTNTANSADRRGNTKNDASNQSRMNSNDYMTPRPARQPALPPIPPETKAMKSSAAGGTQNSNTSVKKPPPLPPSRLGPTFTLYSDKENPTSQARDITSRHRAPPLPPPRIYQSRSMLDLPSSERGETSPLINSEEEYYYTSGSSQYTNNVNPRYIDIVPDNDFNPARVSTQGYEAANQSTNGSMYQLSQDDISELLQWFKRVSKESDTLSLYGLSMEDEIRCFNQQAMHVKKARRLYHLLMMKRKETLQDTLKDFQAICDRLDKVQKTNKTMGIAGGTTGAVGGVTAVVGIALAPVTMGASLIATAVGAGLAVSAGGFGAHAAKANRKIVNRETVEKLVNDYKSDVVDLEQCLHYILCVMKELRRHNIGRMQRAGAHPDALRMADLTQNVFNSNVYSSRQTSPTNIGGMTCESLLKHFAAEFDQYFTEKNGQKLKKSNKSKFSGRLCTLAKSLQEELNYFTQMWEVLS